MTEVKNMLEQRTRTALALYAIAAFFVGCDQDNSPHNGANATHDDIDQASESRDADPDMFVTDPIDPGEPDMRSALQDMHVEPGEADMANTPDMKEPVQDGPVDLRDAILSDRSGDCADYANMYASTVSDVQRGMMFTGNVTIDVMNDVCVLSSNTIPNHDFNDPSARFAHDVAEIDKSFTIRRAPSFAARPSELELSSYDAVMLNGVPVDLLSAGCFGVGDGRIGCGDLSTPYRYDPMGPMSFFGTDQHNAHTQPDGTYHYHGDPGTLFDDQPREAGSPVIGFAADGFPVYGSYFFDGERVREAVSGYTLKTNARAGGPGGMPDGTFNDDYEFTGAGDLDECNGMTVNGQYGYYVTGSYPWVLKCFKGTPHPSFSKRR